MSTTISGLRQLTSNLPAALSRIARQPQIERETAYYTSAIPKVRSLDDFMSNDRVYRYALTAFGLEDMAYGKAFVRRVLSEGIDRRDSFANRLQDPRFREFAKVFNFARYGQATTTFARTQQGTVDRYLRHALESEAGRSNDGVRLALYFERMAPSVATNYSLLADRALLKVTQIALGLPASMAAVDIDRQAEMIGRKLDIADLKDPKKLDRLLTRFAALWDMSQPIAASAPALATVGPGLPVAIGVDVLGQLQNRRKGP